eukprot:scaffold86388_cov57-Phaeocystis_antarctica.AAC.1
MVRGTSEVICDESSWPKNSLPCSLSGLPPGSFAEVNTCAGRGEGARCGRAGRPTPSGRLGSLPLRRRPHERAREAAAHLGVALDEVVGAERARLAVLGDVRADDQPSVGEVPPHQEDLVESTRLHLLAVNVGRRRRADVLHERRHAVGVRQRREALRLEELVDALVVSRQV